MLHPDMITSPAVLDFDRIRGDFPALRQDVRGRRLVYLDNAATAQKPQVVIDAVSNFFATDNANVHRGVHTLSQRATLSYDSVRETVRAFLGAESTDEIIFTKGCTEGINLVSTGLGRAARGVSRISTAGREDSALPSIQPGDELLVSTMEHHSNIVPWQILAAETGAIVRPIPVSDSGEILLEEYRRILSPRTRVVAIVHVSNSLGTVNPIKEMIRLAHEHGALVVVDGAQAGPHLAIDVQDLDADFYTLSCHKIYAPTGVGVLYGKRKWLEALPPYQGGGDMIRSVSFEGTTYAALPAKFEAGTPNIAGVIGLGAAIRYLAGLGGEQALRDGIERVMPAIAQYERSLADSATQELSKIQGLRVIGTAPDKAGIVSFVIDGVHPHDIGTILDTEGVAVRAGHHCTQPLMKRYGVPATARASFAFYNTQADAEALVRSVRKVQEMFA